MNRTLISLTFLSLALFGAQAQAKHYDMLAFGDSITAGLIRNYYGQQYGITSPQWGSRYTQADGYHGYEPVLESLVSSGSNGVDDAYVYNWGYHGETTQYGVNRITSALNSRPADYILIMEGANDVFAGISANTVAFNLGVMVNTARAAGVTPISSTITPNTNNQLGYDFDIKIVYVYNPAITDMANSKEVVLADMYNQFDGPPWYSTYNSGDGLHLSPTGYKRMASVWYDALLTYIKRTNITPIIQLLLLN